MSSAHLAYMVSAPIFARFHRRTNVPFDSLQGKHLTLDIRHFRFMFKAGVAFVWFSVCIATRYDALGTLMPP